MSGGVIKPWVSQEKQVVSGGGQVASFKSVSDFMAPGGGDNGLAALAKGLGQLGGAMHEEGLRRNKAVFDLTMQNEQNEYFAEMNKFIDDFKLNNKGANAAQATAAFEQWNQQRVDVFEEKYGKNDNARLFAASHLGTMAARGLDHMRDYEYQQLEAGLDESYQAGQSLLLNRIATNPEEAPELIPQLLANSAAEANRKGTTPEARALQAQTLNKATLPSIAKALVESGDIEGAEKLFQSTVPATQFSEQPAGGEFVVPTVGTLNSPFGPRSRPKAGASANHMAVDIGAPEGTPIKAAGSGTVIFAGRKGGYGNTVVIQHDDGSYETQYGHMQGFAKGLKTGDKVTAGQVIGAVGSTGVSTGPHLDFKVKDVKSGQWVDPSPFLGVSKKGDQVRERTQAVDSEAKPVMVASANTTGDTATDAGGIMPGGEAVEPQAAETVAPAKDYKDHPWAGLFSAAELKEIDDMITAAKDDRMIKTLTAQHAAAVDNNSEAEIADANLAAVEEIKATAAGDPERQLKLLDALAKNQQFADKERHIRDGAATEEYYTAAEGMTPLDRQKLLSRDEWRGKFSRATWNNLMKAEEGGANEQRKEQSYAAFDALMVEIDRRNRGVDGLDPYTEGELKADAYAAGLSREQVEKLIKYRAEGGMAGVDGFAGKVQDIYLEYFEPGSDEYKKAKAAMPPGFLNMVAEHLQPGTKPSNEEIRKAVAMATMRSRQGRTWKSFDRMVSPRELEVRASDLGISDAGWNFSHNFAEASSLTTVTDSRGETAYQAIARKRIGQWLPKVESWEVDSIDAALSMAGWKANETTRALWKKAETLGIKLTDDENDLIEKYKVW